MSVTLLIEAAKVALVALHYHTQQTRPIAKTESAITALRSALDKVMVPPDPVGWGQLGLLNGQSYLRESYSRTPYPPPFDVRRNLNLVPLYAEPQWVEDRRSDGMPASSGERHLRRLLAIRVAMPHIYMDDGEAQGQEHGISIDFMRESVADIDAKLRALNVARRMCSVPK